MVVMAFISIIESFFKDLDSRNAVTIEIAPEWSMLDEDNLSSSRAELGFLKQIENPFQLVAVMDLQH